MKTLATLSTLNSVDLHLMSWVYICELDILNHSLSLQKTALSQYTIIGDWTTRCICAIFNITKVKGFVCSRKTRE